MLGAYLLAAAAAGPHIAEIKTFGDWVVGCDNGRLCQASAMMPETDTGVTLTVRRGPEGCAVPELWFRPWEGEAADLAADGKRLNLRVAKVEKDYNEAFVVAPADAVRALDALRAARSVTVLDASGKPIGAVLVDGATAALLYMDEQQLRLGTQGALVRRGAKPDSAVPPPPALPVVPAVRGSSKPPARLSPAFVARVRKDNDCADETDPGYVHHARLDEKHTYASITLICQSGAYNYISEDFIIPDGGAPRPARFDDEANHEEGDMSHYNLSWDATARRLHAGFKGRGLGDCGGRQQYAWDGRQFRLVAVSGMDDCRGVIDFISLWRARVVER
jgi:hypothetical protein